MTHSSKINCIHSKNIVLFFKSYSIYLSSELKSISSIQRKGHLIGKWNITHDYWTSSFPSSNVSFFLWFLSWIFLVFLCLVMTKSLLGQEAGINVYPSVQWRKAVLEGWCLFSMEGHFKSSKIDQITLRIGWTLDNLICKSALISFLWFLCAAVWFERSWCDKAKLNHLRKSCENNGQHTKGSFKSRPKSVEKDECW